MGGRNLFWRKSGSTTPTPPHSIKIFLMKSGLLVSRHSPSCSASRVLHETRRGKCSVAHRVEGGISFCLWVCDVYFRGVVYGVSTDVLLSYLGYIAKVCPTAFAEPVGKRERKKPICKSIICIY